MDMDMEIFEKTIKAIREKHGLTQENRFRPAHSVKDTIKCLDCGGTLHYTIAALNGHIWGQCETENCMSWMM